MHKNNFAADIEDINTGDLLTTTWNKLHQLSFSDLVTLNYDTSHTFEKAQKKIGFFKRGSKNQLTIIDLESVPQIYQDYNLPIQIAENYEEEAPWEEGDQSIDHGSIDLNDKEQHDSETSEESQHKYNLRPRPRKVSIQSSCVDSIPISTLGSFSTLSSETTQVAPHFNKQLDFAAQFNANLVSMPQNAAQNQFSKHKKHNGDSKNMKSILKCTPVTQLSNEHLLSHTKTELVALKQGLKHFLVRTRMR